MSVFVTVGTTSFDKLVSTVTEKDILQKLLSLGYHSVRIQTGRGVVKPPHGVIEGVRIESFDFKPNIKDEFDSASLVISHAGAGSCLEALEAKVPLIVVVNEGLMNNHQIELAMQLGKEGYLYYCNCDTLLQTLETKNLRDLKTYPETDPKIFANFLDKVVGFSLE